jgi:HSP20 family molecular chaperone IbpA
VKPAYRIRETPEAYAVTVHLPGVAKDAIELTAEDHQFRLTARRAWKQPTDWTALHRESSSANYELVLVHDNAINGEKISAELRDGVLRLSLPKTEAVKPRKIAIA